MKGTPGLQTLEYVLSLLPLSAFSHALFVFHLIISVFGDPLVRAFLIPSCVLGVAVTQLYCAHSPRVPLVGERGCRCGCCHPIF